VTAKVRERVSVSQQTA